MVKVLKKILSVIHFIFIRTSELLMLLGILVIRFFFLSPLFVIQNLVTFGITAWIYGQLVALVTVHRFLRLSYFDITQYPDYVQEAWNRPVTSDILSLLSIYTTPLVLFFVIEFVVSFWIWFIPRGSDKGGE